MTSRELAVKALMAHANHMSRPDYDSEMAILEVTAAIEAERSTWRERVEKLRAALDDIGKNMCQLVATLQSKIPCSSTGWACYPCAARRALAADTEASR